MAKPDYAFWAAQPEYTLRNAAFLCCDLEPENPSNWDYRESPRVAATLSRIKKEIPNRPPAEDAFLHGPAPGWSHLVSREALRAWAEDTGQRAVMPFLFWEEEEEINSDAMRADTKEGYLFLIGLLVHALAGKSGQDAKDTQGPKNAGILRLLEATAKRLEVPMAGLGKSQGSDKLTAALVEVGNRQTQNRKS